MRKTGEEVYAPPSFDDRESEVKSGEAHVPAHKDFRDKYFNKFGKDTEVMPLAAATATAQPNPATS